jgi:hypothetical protein
VDRHPINELFYAPQGPMKSSKQSFNFPTIELEDLERVELPACWFVANRSSIELQVHCNLEASGGVEPNRLMIRSHRFFH